MHNVLSQIQRHAIEIWTARPSHSVVSQIATPANTRKMSSPSSISVLFTRVIMLRTHSRLPIKTANRRNCFWIADKMAGVILPVGLSTRRVISVVKDYQTSKCLPSFSLPLPMRNPCCYVRLFGIYPWPQD